MEMIGISIFIYTKRGKFSVSLRRVDLPGFLIEFWFGWLCISAGFLTKLATDAGTAAAPDSVSYTSQRG